MTKINITVEENEEKPFKLKVDGKEILIPINQKLYTSYQYEFAFKKSPTAKGRKGTLLKLMEYAYKKGLEDGKNK